MDGVIYDSMPNHAQAWEEVMSRHHLPFTAYDCYLNEGRTGVDIITTLIRETRHYEPSDEEVQTIFRQKGDAFVAKGGAGPVKGIADVMAFLHSRGVQIWVVTGSAQATLLDTLNVNIGPYFDKSRMVTALDVTEGKPSPMPYLTALRKSGLPIEDCCVVENAPLGIRSAKAAGLYAVAVNTGPLPDSLLWNEGADQVFPDMPALLNWLQKN